MANTHETIADIIAAKRREANYIVQVSQGKCQTRRDKAEDEARDIRREADRIEAAHKREIEATAAKCCQLGRLAGYGASEIKHQQEPVGDAAKLREALVQVQKKIKYLIGNLTVPNSLVASRMEINGIINAALAAPPRNCERFATVKDAAIAFARERQDAPQPCPDFTFSAWLLAPATEKEGGAR